MNVLNDNWLDSFITHSIFHAEKEHLEIYQKAANFTRQSSNFALQHHSQLITIRDNDLFVAVGSEIRVVNLTTCKDNWIKGTQDSEYDWIASTPYFVLNTPEINFNVESLTANKNGRLLAVKGNNKLVVVCLPRQSFSNNTESTPDNKVLCRTLSVGTNIYEKSEILKVEWHPLSETRTHIVVLGSDNYLRIFDISMDIEEPEQFFDLSPVQRKPENEQSISRIGISCDDDDNSEEDAVSFSLGGPSKDQSGWEPFTVFYTLRNGHMYALCPVIPYRSSIRRSHLDSLSCISYAKFEQSKNSDSDDHKTLSYLYQLQCSWISSLFKSAKTLSADTLLVSSDANHNAFPVQRQGPFLVNQSIDIEAGVESTDILYINVDPISIIALAYTDGTVDNYVIGSEIDAQWEMPMHNPKSTIQKKLGYLLCDSSFLPAASLYETLKVKAQASPERQSMVFVADPLYEDTYYVYHTAGVHAVSLNKWVQPLCKISSSYETGQSQESKKALELWLKEKATSEVRLLVDSSPLSQGYVPVIGLVVITDMYLSYSVLSLTLTYQLVTRDLYIRRDPSANKSSQDAVKMQLKHLQDESSDTGDSYQSLLPLPAFQPPSQLDSLPKQTKIVVPPNMNGKEIVVNEETLRFFSDTSLKIRREAHKVKKDAADIDKRLMIQQKEFERQVKSLRDLYNKFQKISSPTTKTAQTEKLEEICKNHAKLRLRMDEQLRLLMQSYQPDLSIEEKNWINKLEKLSDKITGNLGYVARIDLLKSQMQQLEPSSSLNREKLSKLNTTQLENVLRTLKQQGLTIDEVEKRLKAFETKLSLKTAS